MAFEALYNQTTFSLNAVTIYTTLYWSLSMRCLFKLYPFTHASSTWNALSSSFLSNSYSVFKYFEKWKFLHSSPRDHDLVSLVWGPGMCIFLGMCIFNIFQYFWSGWSVNSPLRNTALRERRFRLANTL